MDGAIGLINAAHICASAFKGRDCSPLLNTRPGVPRATLTKSAHR
jgi:hypothetical protein